MIHVSQTDTRVTNRYMCPTHLLMHVLHVLADVVGGEVNGDGKEGDADDGTQHVEHGGQLPVVEGALRVPFLELAI